MVCSPCRIGGNYNRQANAIVAADVRDFLHAKAKEQHDLCVGCTCQHEVGAPPAVDPAMNNAAGAGVD
jgi:hypothetical protein